jgi:hypothetical protein
MTKYLTTTIVLTVFLAGSTLAQTIAPSNQPSKQPSIWIGMQLQLGMSRDDIISKLAANYKLTKVQSAGDDWIVAEKQNTEIWQGYLGFHDAKLTYASRSWTQGGEDTFSFAQALWRAMSEMDREGHNACSFDVPTTNSPTAEIRYVRFYCGAKKIEIMTTDVLNGEAKGHHVSISEILSSEKLR